MHVLIAETNDFVLHKVIFNHSWLGNSQYTYTKMCRVTWKEEIQEMHTPNQVSMHIILQLHNMCMNVYE